jgi:hypothetical protein
MVLPLSSDDADYNDGRCGGATAQYVAQIILGRQGEPARSAVQRMAASAGEARLVSAQIGTAR